MKKILKYLKYYVVIIGILMGLLFLVSLIPRKYSENHIKTSYEQLGEAQGEVKNLIPGLYSSKIDLYADSIWINITYYLDSKKPISSVLEGAYYFKSEEVKTRVQQLQAIEKRNLPI